MNVRHTQKMKTLVELLPLANTFFQQQQQQNLPHCAYPQMKSCRWPCPNMHSRIFLYHGLTIILTIFLGNHWHSEEVSPCLKHTTTQKKYIRACFFPNSPDLSFPSHPLRALISLVSRRENGADGQTSPHTIWDAFHTHLQQPACISVSKYCVWCVLRVQDYLRYHAVHTTKNRHVTQTLQRTMRVQEP